jgi:hypothetical protein
MSRLKGIDFHAVTMFQMKSSQLYVVNGLVMLVTFFFCRVVMFPYVFCLYSRLAGLSYWEVRSSFWLGILTHFSHDIAVRISDAFHDFESIVDIHHWLAGSGTTSLGVNRTVNFKEHRHRC